MGRAYDVEQFLAQGHQLTDLEGLRNLLYDATKHFGFDYYALLNHIDLTLPAPEVVHVYNYPEAWVGTIIERGYFTDDPMLAAAQKSPVGFLWTDIGKIIELSPRHKEILTAAGEAGMGDGFTTPVNVPGEYHGSCSFGTRYGKSISRGAIPAAHYMGHFAFLIARKIVHMKTLERSNMTLQKSPTLTQRERECLQLAARGKSDVDIAQLLGLSAPTVHGHIENAKKRYNVATRGQLVISALFRSQLTFADILR